MQVINLALSLQSDGERPPRCSTRDPGAHPGVGVGGGDQAPRPRKRTTHIEGNRRKLCKSVGSQGRIQGGHGPGKVHVALRATGVSCAKLKLVPKRVGPHLGSKPRDHRASEPGTGSIRDQVLRRTPDARACSADTVSRLAGEAGATTRR